MKRRLFIGLPLSSKLQKRLISEIAHWKEWPIIPTHPGQLHITLVYLGFILEEEIPRIITALEDTCLDFEPFEVRFSEICAEPREKPNLVWLTGDSSEALVKLRNTTATALEYLTPDLKHFRPHVTLAKIRRHQWNTLPVKPDFTKLIQIIETIDMVTLWESTILDGKRAYLPIAECSLGG